MLLPHDHVLHQSVASYLDLVVVHVVSASISTDRIPTGEVSDACPSSWLPGLLSSFWWGVQLTRPSSAGVPPASRTRCIAERSCALAWLRLTT